MGKVQVPEEDLLEAIGEGLTDAEIGSRLGLDASVVANVIRAVCRRRSKSRVALMLDWLEKHADPLGIEAADAWEVVLDKMLPRSRILLSEMLHVSSGQSVVVDLGDVRTALQGRLRQLESEQTGELAHKSLTVLRAALRDAQGLAIEINTAAQAAGLPPQPEHTWIKLVRLVYLSSAFQLAVWFSPEADEGA
jgi:hypothetical protein